jgi:hypothetical protein
MEVAKKLIFLVFVKKYLRDPFDVDNKSKVYGEGIGIGEIGKGGCGQAGGHIVSLIWRGCAKWLKKSLTFANSNRYNIYNVVDFVQIYFYCGLGREPHVCDYLFCTLR